MSIDERQEDQPELDESLFAEETAEEAQPQEPVEPQKTEESEADDLPDKYRGKTALELIQMHQEAERLAGRQGNELGDLRKIIDDILDERANSSPAPQHPEEEDVDFFDDPKKATTKWVQEALKSDPRLQEFENTSKQQAQASAAQRLMAKHPDGPEILQDPAFGEWIGKSQVRMKMFHDAHVNFDADVGIELFDLWKERKRDVQQVVDNSKKERRDQTRRASTGSGRSSESRSQPILSRDALVELRRTDPEKYMRLMPQIKKAYEERRVK